MIPSTFRSSPEHMIVSITGAVVTALPLSLTAWIQFVMSSPLISGRTPSCTRTILFSPCAIASAAFSPDKWNPALSFRLERPFSLSLNLYFPAIHSETDPSSTRHRNRVDFRMLFKMFQRINNDLFPVKLQKLLRKRLTVSCVF